MKAVYIDFVPEGNIGVRQKITYQIEAFEDLGVAVTHANYNNGFNFGSKKIIYSTPKGKIKRKICEIVIARKLSKLDFSDYDFVYLRYVRMTPWFYGMLAALSKKANKVYIEIATYPYDGEVNDFSILTLSDKFFRTKISRYVDAIFCFGKAEKRIWGIPSIEMFNAINLDKVKFLCVDKKESEKEIINFIAVSKLAKWHGYDRFIQSMNNLPDKLKKRVRFHIVGDGSEKKKIEELVLEYNLTNNVVFYGNLNGERLDEVYKQADVGVASLGLYRIGLDELTPIKMSEYTARGLPFILANKDPRFKYAKFVYRVPNQGGAFDLEEVIRSHESSKVSRISIRKYAEENLSWTTQMRKVVEYHANNINYKQ